MGSTSHFQILMWNRCGIFPLWQTNLLSQIWKLVAWWISGTYTHSKCTYAHCTTLLHFKIWQYEASFPLWKKMCIEFMTVFSFLGGFDSHQFCAWQQYCILWHGLVRVLPKCRMGYFERSIWKACQKVPLLSGTLSRYLKIENFIYELDVLNNFSNEILSLCNKFRF